MRSSAPGRCYNRAELLALRKIPSGSLLRGCLLAAFLLALGIAQVEDSLAPQFSAHLEIVVERSDTGEVVPARVYLFRAASRSG